MKLTDIVQLNEAEVDAAFLQKVKAALSKVQTGGTGATASGAEGDGTRGGNSRIDAIRANRDVRDQVRTGQHEMNKKFDAIVAKAQDTVDITSAFVDLPQEVAGRDEGEELMLRKSLIGYANKKYLGGPDENFRVNTRAMAQEILRKRGPVAASNEPEDTRTIAQRQAAGQQAARDANAQGVNMNTGPVELDF